MKQDITKHSPRARRIGRVLYLLSFVLECHVAAAAEPLDLDQTFNGTGKVVINLLNPLFALDDGRAVAIQQDGKIVAVGAANSGGEKGYDFAMVRYNPDGTIDNMFGTTGNGRVITDIASKEDDPTGVVIQPDGKIVIAGQTSNLTGEDNSFDVVLARYDPGGTLDQSFGTNGLARVDFGSYEQARSVALQQDGKIVVGGWQESNGGERDFLIIRFLPNGSLDTSFGDAGKVVTDLGGSDRVLALTIQGDGKIVAVGSTWAPNFQMVRGALVRYNADGTLDSSFDSGLGLFCLYFQFCGKVKIYLGGGTFDFPVSVASRKSDGTEDGKIVVAGQFGVARFNANGSLDKDFGNAGIMNNPDNTGNTVAILGSGNIVVAGEAFGSNDFGVAIYEATGQRCSVNGSVTTDFNGDIDRASAMAIQADGKILVIGSTGQGTYEDFALARYKGGACSHNILLAPWVAGHIFIHPQDLIGPPAPLFRDELYKRLQIGSSEQLVIPASTGSAFAGPTRPGYQAFKLINDGGESRQKGSLLAVTNDMGDQLLELVEAQQLLVPTEIAAEPAEGVPASGLRSAPFLKCYRVKMHSSDGALRVRKSVSITDALKHTRTFEVGEPESLCKPIDRRGRELIGPALGLMSYRVKDIKTSGTYPVRLSTVNEFGARVLRVEQPEILFLPSFAQ
jgi:uncharacterized delta-60 repeat protein